MSYFGPHKLVLLKDDISAPNGYVFVSEILKKPSNVRFIMDALVSVNSEQWGSRSLFETHNSLES